MKKKLLSFLITCIVIAMVILTIVFFNTVKNPLKLLLFWFGLGLILTLSIGLFIILIPLYKGIKKGNLGTWYYKVLGILLSIIFICAVAYETMSITNLVKDLDDYREQNFEVITGYMESPYFTNPNSTKKHNKYSGNRDEELWFFKIGDMRLKVVNFYIFKKEYDNNIKGKLITVTYLPNSKIAVDWEYAEKEE